ncbi:TPA: hypothetical protein ACH3X2_012129 [Trebouxia sp. C0005]
MAVHHPTNSAKISLSRVRARNSVPFCKGVSVSDKFVQQATFPQQRPSNKQVRFSKQQSQGFVPVQCSHYTGADGDGLQQANATAPTAVGVDQPQSASTSMTQSVYQPASLSRVFIGVQPGRGVARLTKVGKPSGPMSLLLLLFTVAGTISAAVRSRLESAARECSTCHGYGINRCTLCSGTGAVGWEGKWNHKEPCPMCLGKRFVDCPECGGHFHRRIFNHHHHTGLTVTELVEAEQGTFAKLGD